MAASAMPTTGIPTIPKMTVTPRSFSDWAMMLAPVRGAELDDIFVMIWRWIGEVRSMEMTSILTPRFGRWVDWR